ncbi:hypothetical protein CDAR_533311 [Caerostris darwini]|uniref:LAGLIDADG homing endonuclease n=1 Tax=Caerostris darwini TaxID=1538125 RepID=A0AAV4WVL4_9ARAC|nr:hypothetical protein CDAR_533311 [Caerostris darwini]
MRGSDNGPSSLAISSNPSVVKISDKLVCKDNIGSLYLKFCYLPSSPFTCIAYLVGLSQAAAGSTFCVFEFNKAKGRLITKEKWKEGVCVGGVVTPSPPPPPAFFVRSEIPPLSPWRGSGRSGFVLKLVIESNDAVENGGANHPATHRHFIYRLLRMQLSKSARTVIRNVKLKNNHLSVAIESDRWGRKAFLRSHYREVLKA